MMQIFQDKLTALHVAAHCGNLRSAQILLDAGCDVNAKAKVGDVGYIGDTTTVYFEITLLNIILNATVIFTLGLSRTD